MVEISKGKCCVEIAADEMKVLVISLTAAILNQSVRLGMESKIETRFNL